MFSIKSGKSPGGTGIKLRPGEDILWEISGGFTTLKTARWQMGVWYATRRSIIFVKDGKTIWSCPYQMISRLDREERSFAFGIKETLRIEYRDGSKTLMAWSVVSGLDEWEKFIRPRAFPEPLTEELICQIASEVDTQSEQLIWHFWKSRHSTIDDMISLGISDDPMEILKKIKEVINPRAEELFGYPLFVFCDRRVDGLTKREIQNSWWLTDPLSLDV